LFIIKDFVPLLVKERKKICLLCNLEEDKDRSILSGSYFYFKLFAVFVPDEAERRQA